MFCAPAKIIHHGTHGEHGGKGGLLPSLLHTLGALRDFRGEDRLRFTKLDVALHHLTLLDANRDSTKRTHGGEHFSNMQNEPTVPRGGLKLGQQLLYALRIDWVGGNAVAL